MSEPNTSASIDPYFDRIFDAMQIPGAQGIAIAREVVLEYTTVAIGERAGQVRVETGRDLSCANRCQNGMSAEQFHQILNRARELFPESDSVSCDVDVLDGETYFFKAVFGGETKRAILCNPRGLGPRLTEAAEFCDTLLKVNDTWFQKVWSGARWWILHLAHHRRCALDC